MKNKQQEFFHTTQTSEDFLLYKTDEKNPEGPGDQGAENSGEILSLHFPATLSGKAFLDSALDQLGQADRFGVLAIRLDENTESGNVPDPEDLLAFFKALDSLGRRGNGLWGQLEPCLFICFLPGKTGDEARDEARRLQKELSNISSQTLTIGIASFPNMDYEKKDMAESALKALDHASFFGPGATVVFDAVSLNISGDHYYQKGDIESAVSEFKTALKMDSGNVNVLNSIGVCYAVMGDFNVALEYFKAAGDHDPEEVMAWYNMALVHKLKGDKQKALEFFLKADSLKNDVFEVVFQTGKIYFETGEQETGRNYYLRALELSSGIQGSSRFIGDCFAGLGSSDKAVRNYQKAIKENPDDAHALSALGALYDLQGENPEIAAVFCRQSVDIAPRNSLFRRRLGLLYLKQNRYNEALKEFKTAEELDVSNSSQLLEQTARKAKKPTGHRAGNVQKTKKSSKRKSVAHGDCNMDKEE